MSMTDREVGQEINKERVRAPLDDSQDRGTVEDEFPGMVRAVRDPYQR